MDPLATAPAEPRLGTEGEHCARCDAPLSVDQRYCLNCGRRRAEMRLPFVELFGAPGTARAAGAAPPPGAAQGERSPLVALAALIALLLALGIGVLLGRGANDAPPTAARAPIITVAAPGAAAAVAEPAAVVSDWPAGTEGYTVQLRTLPATAAAAEVDQAKRDATAKGAPDVGALNSDEHASLTPAQILVYSGNHPTRAAATKARRALRSAFPDAEVVRVGSAAAGDSAAAGKPPDTTTAPSRGATAPRSTPGYGKSTNKLPDKIETEGAPPPVDDKAPGGGSGEATEIG